MPFRNEPHISPSPSMASTPTLKNSSPRLALTYAASLILKAFQRRLYARAARLLRSSGGAPTASLHLCSARSAAKSHTSCFLFIEFKNGWEITSFHHGCGRLGCACNLGTLGIHAQIKRCVMKLLYSEIRLKTQLQMDFDYGEEYECSTDDILGDEYPAAASVDQGIFQLGFGISKPGKKDKNGDPVITIIDRSGIHEIGVRWCCCFDAPERDMQLMTAGLFPATFRNPKTAFTFRVLEEFHLDNLECKTTPSQFFSRLRRLTSDEFPNTVRVGQAIISADSILTCRYRIDIGSC
jgi:CxC2 like cysteine cluster associated with KDZ transposases